MGVQPDNEKTIQKQRWRSWFYWSTRDILLLAGIGIVFGLILGAFLYPYLALLALGPFVTWGLTALYFLPSFFIVYVLRRPGAALLMNLVYNLVMLPFSPFGIILVIGALMHGTCMEIGIALVTRYRSFSLLTMALAGTVTSLIDTFVYNIFYPDALKFALPIVIGVVVVTALCCTFIAVVAKLLADAIARTGALSGTVLKSENMQEV